MKAQEITQTSLFPDVCPDRIIEVEDKQLKRSIIKMLKGRNDKARAA